MPIVKITVDMLDEARPVARKGLMLIDLSCDMTTAQMFQAIQSMRESITSTTWGEWMKKWTEEDGSYLEVGKESFPE
jgi:hypothetical protein